MTELRVAAGDILARKYRVERVLGQGAMGVVVAATHVDLGHPVALKLMLPDKEQTSEMRERFLREARAAVRLKSQHVAKVSDVGTDEHDMPYIAMEFLEGDDLAALLKKRGPLPVEEAVEYVLQACEAVGEAHAAGIVHRDLKPANMFLTRDVSGAPCIKVLDFGISKVMGAELTLTQETQALGSPLYMSPEALGSAKNVDTRTDIWAFGVILYQLVAKKTPFHEPTMGQLCTRILTGEPTPLSEYRTDVPAGFEAVIHHCLKKDRNARFATIAALAHAIAPFGPARARVYVERIARIMGVDLAILEAAEDLSELQATLPLSARPRAQVPSLPGAGATSQAGVMVPESSAEMDAPAKPKSKLPLVLIGAAAVVVPGLFFVLGGSSETSTNAAGTTPALSSSAATNAPVDTNAMVTAAPATAAPSASAATTTATTSPAKGTTPVGAKTGATNPTKTKKASKGTDYDERQ